MFNLKLTAVLAAGAGLSLVPATAQAAELLFELSGDATASFMLNSNPTPDSSDSDMFYIDSVDVIFNGVPNVYDLQFYSSELGGGFSFTDDLNYTGNTLFSGSTSDPVFSTGVFALSDYAGNGGAYTLSISSVRGAVPEPASWAMMLIGFGGIGYSLRRKKFRPRLNQTAAI
jgi:hypothetical protein